MKVLKFGGSSVASAAQIKKVAQIIAAQEGRKVIVVSAPGKRTDDDIKITDALIAYARTSDEEHFNFVLDRFMELSVSLKSSVDIATHLDEIKSHIKTYSSHDYILSRGEYLNALLIADYLGATFLDAKDLITINRDSSVTDASYKHIASSLENEDLVVIPGFYGQTPDGRIQTFSRGGSDITGAIIAKAIQAEVYQNWTDVSGIYQGDPRVAKRAKPIAQLTYNEMLALADYGANVLHPDAVTPAKDAGITINVRNTNEPENPGTLIVPERDITQNPIAAVAVKKNYGLLTIRKTTEEASGSIINLLMPIIRRHNIVIYRNFEDPRQLRFLITYPNTDFLADLSERDGSFFGNLAQVGIVGEGMMFHLDRVSKAVTYTDAGICEMTYAGTSFDFLIDEKYCDDMLDKLIHGERNIFI